MVCVVGGDGTINEVAQDLLHSDIPLAVIPKGYGSGFSNCIHIPQCFTTLDIWQVGQKTSNYFGKATVNFMLMSPSPNLLGVR